MKKFIAVLLISNFHYTSFAQQLPLSSFYEMQGVLNNPATAGLQHHGVIGTTFRSQWSSIPGSPKTAVLFGSAFLQKAHLGLGGYVYNDVTGPIKNTGLQMAYAYQVPLSNEATFSLGIEGRFQQFSMDKQKLQESLGANDPVLSGDAKKIKGDAGFGMVYTDKKLLIGLSVSQLVQSRLNLYSGSTPGNEKAKFYRHYYLQAQFNWQVDDAVKIIPNLLAVYLPNAPTELQGGIRVEHQQLFWYGLSLRKDQGWLFSAGINVKQMFRIGYSFDLYNTPSSIYDKGSNGQEIMLAYHFIH